MHKAFSKKTKIKKTLDFILHIISYSSVETRKHKALSDKQKLKKALKSVIKTLLGEEKTFQKRRFRPFGTFPTVRKKTREIFYNVDCYISTTSCNMFSLR